MKFSASEVNSSRISSSWTRPAAMTSAVTGTSLALVRARNFGMSSVLAGM